MIFFRLQIYFIIIMSLLFLYLKKKKLQLNILINCFKPSKCIPNNYGPQWYEYKVNKIMKFFFDDNCLNRNLILFYLLNKFIAFEYYLVIGAAKNPALESHCWLEHNNLIIFESVISGKTNNYTSFIRYSANSDIQNSNNF